MIEDALRDAGFECSIVSSGEEALTLFSGHKDSYRALVTDINLRGSVDGWEVARRIRESAPGIPVVYMTGASADQWTAHGVPHSILLNKPFAPAQLVTAVAQLLNAGAPDASGPT
jgi:DNA-binding response OmpR family regulator